MADTKRHLKRRRDRTKKRRVLDYDVPPQQLLVILAPPSPPKDADIENEEE